MDAGPLSPSGSARSSGALMVLGFALFAIGAVMWFQRQGDPTIVSGLNGAYVIWERGLIVAGLIFNVAGLVLFETLLRGAGNHTLGRLGVYGYAFAAIFAVAYEAIELDSGISTYPLIVTYVVLALLAQAALGAALLTTGLFPAWLAWLAIGWNLIWLVALPVVSPRDMYYPVLHHFVPLLMGMLLLSGARQGRPAYER